MLFREFVVFISLHPEVFNIFGSFDEPLPLNSQYILVKRHGSYASISYDFISFWAINIKVFLLLIASPYLDPQHAC